MKFPYATVILVSSALLFILWNQFREQPEAVDASRFTNLAANPVERSVAVDWLITEIPALCEQATGQSNGTDAHASCVKQSRKRTSTCRRSIYDQFPGHVSSEAAFRDLSITLINCLMPRP
ncbi:MAG TPA: hypothetical protein VL091_03490 [Marinobacter sp.]|nr:hypothetical protein [Marinobacter sp.]